MKAAKPAPLHKADIRRVAVICLLLVSWFSFAAATHFHALSTSSSEGHCEFCLVVHGGSDAVPAATAAMPLPNLIATPAPVAADCAAKSFLPDFDLYSRPPPLV